MEEQQQTVKESIKNASEEVSQQFKTLINNDDLDSINQSQQLILGRLQDSNAILSHFNEYSERCFAEVSGDFTRNTRLLRSMKTDLDYIFQKLRCHQLPIPTVLAMETMEWARRFNLCQLSTFGGNLQIIDATASSGYKGRNPA